jgi:nitrate/TMAO reductase-like tetraheme cytochrome c subunit
VEAKAKMKRSVLLVSGLLLVVLILAAGCNREVTLEKETASSCVTCHTNKDTLKEVASPEPEAVTSEATTGEG